MSILSLLLGNTIGKAVRDSWAESFGGKIEAAIVVTSVSFLYLSSLTSILKVVL